MSPPRPKSSPAKAEPATQLSFEARFAAVTTTTTVVTQIVVEQEPAPPPERIAPRAAPRVFAVSELVRAARLTMEARFADVLVQGEVSGCRRSGPGHIYFTLKDDAAAVDCVIFSREAARLKFRLDDGLQVRCRGRLTIFEGRGKFQLGVIEIEPAGAGALALAFEQLKQKLAAEGLFEKTRKRALPFLPRCIGVVSSASGAVIRDIIRVAHRRFPAEILLAPAAVQGDGAAAQLIAALALIARAPRVDVVIVARGGGSMEDLFCFNDEVLARAIAACPIPVISAVGHETDFTIADFVADVRAPTPSAAAELALPVLGDLLAELHVLARRTARAAEARVRDGRLRLERARRVLSDPRRLLSARQQDVDDLAARALEATRGGISQRRTALRASESRLLRAHPARRIRDQRATLGALEKRLAAAWSARAAPRRRALATMQGKLEALSPLKVLERGYGLARGRDGHVITSARELCVGDEVTIALRDGEVVTRVEAIPPETSR